MLYPNKDESMRLCLNPCKADSVLYTRHIHGYVYLLAVRVSGNGEGALEIWRLYGREQLGDAVGSVGGATAKG